MGSESFSNLNDSLPENHWGGLWWFWVKTSLVYYVKDTVVKFPLKQHSEGPSALSGDFSGAELPFGHGEGCDKDPKPLLSCGEGGDARHSARKGSVLSFQGCSLPSCCSRATSHASSRRTSSTARRASTRCPRQRWQHRWRVTKPSGRGKQGRATRSPVPEPRGPGSPFPGKGFPGVEDFAAPSVLKASQRNPLQDA